MIRVGIIIIIDDRFRAETLCRICRQPIGSKDFCIAVQPLPPNSVDVEYYEHTECKVKADKEFLDCKDRTAANATREVPLWRALLWGALGGFTLWLFEEAT